MDRRITELKSESTDLKSEISDLESQISDLKSEISDLKSQISDSKSQISDLKSEISNLESPAGESDAPAHLAIESSAHPDSSKTRLIAVLIVALLAWGVIHAVGAYRFNHDLRRPAMVLACVLGFLGFWGLLLWGRRRKIEKRQ
jgi:hypothetical protein